MQDLLNKYVLQYILCHGILKWDEGDRLVRTIAERINERPKNFNTVISEINEDISKQLFKIDSKICEITGEKCCVLINKSIDEVSKASTNHTPAELELFTSILSTIMTSDSKFVSSIMCLNLTSGLSNKISKDAAQDKIHSWVKHGYLVKKNGLVYLGARTASEFQIYLKSEFAARMTTCKLCTDFVYYGKICAECNEVLHIHCSSKYIEKTSKCPACKKPWQEAEGRVYEEENSDDEEDANESMDTD